MNEEQIFAIIGRLYTQLYTASAASAQQDQKILEQAQQIKVLTSALEGRTAAPLQLPNGIVNEPSNR